MLARLIKLPLTITYTDDTFVMSVTPPEHARLGAVGVSVKEFAALYNHGVSSINHHRREFVTRDNVTASGPYNVPLGHIVNCLVPSDLDATGPRVQRFQPWPGLINNFADFDDLRLRRQRGEALTLHETFRLGNFGKLPCRDFAMALLKPTFEFRIEGARIIAGTTITRAYLWCVELTQADYDLFARREDSEYLDSPQWLGHCPQLTAAAAVDAPAERKWNGATLPNLGLQVFATFATAYSNTAGTRAQDQTYLQAVQARWLGADREALFESYSDKRQELAEQSYQLLQEYDGCRRLGLWFGWNSRHYVELEHSVTAQINDLRMTHYGLLKHSDRNGRMIGASPVCVC